MTTVAQYFGCKSFPTIETMFGVEVEVEGKNLPSEVLGFISKHDGSLRGESYEYIFDKPYPFKVSLELIKHLNKSLEKSELDMSFRTSVHVHVNVSDYTKNQLCTFLYLAFLLEEPLVRFSGESRVGNRFCLRVKDAEGKVRELEDLFLRDEYYIKDQNSVKYSAINLASLKRFGTIEFRSMRGTVDVKVLSKWLYLIDAIFMKAKQFERPIDVFNKLEEIGPSRFLYSIFGDLMEDIDYKGIDQDVVRNKSLLITLPFEYKEQYLVAKGAILEKKKLYVEDLPHIRVIEDLLNEI